VAAFDRAKGRSSFCAIHFPTFFVRFFWVLFSSFIFRWPQKGELFFFYFFNYSFANLFAFFLKKVCCPSVVRKEKANDTKKKEEKRQGIAAYCVRVWGVLCHNRKRLPMETESEVDIVSFCFLLLLLEKKNTKEMTDACAFSLACTRPRVQVLKRGAKKSIYENQ